MRGRVVPVEPRPAAPSDAPRSALWGRGVASPRGSPACNVAGAQRDQAPPPFHLAQANQVLGEEHTRPLRGRLTAFHASTPREWQVLD